MFSYLPYAFLFQAARPSCTFVTQVLARIVASAQSAGVASVVTALWALVAKTVGSVSGQHRAGGICRIRSVSRIGAVTLLLLSPQPWPIPTISMATAH